MKYGKKVAAVLFVVAILSSMSVWAQAKAGKAASNLTGTKWVAKIGGVSTTLTFTSANEGTCVSIVGRGTFSCTANKITLTPPFPGTYEYTVSGDTLTIKKLYLNTADIQFDKKKTAEKEAKSDSEKRKTLVEGVEFTVTPAIGLSATASSLKPLWGTSSIKASAAQFNIGLQGTMIGLPVAQKADWMDNFTSILNMDMGVGGKITLKDNDDTTRAPVSGGVLFQMSLLAGYKFTMMEKFHLTPAIGLGYASSGITGNDDGWPVVFGGGTFSIPLYADVKYFFTDLIGIDLNIINSLEFGIVTATTPVFGDLGTSSFRNIFTLKVGPVFRF